jgi:hypothetical protein
MVSIVVAIIALVVAGLLIGVIAAAVKTGQAEGGNSVIKNVYIYLVLRKSTKAWASSWFLLLLITAAG